MFLKKLTAKQVLLLIILFTTFLRLFRLDYPNKYIFDEVYHAFTAKEYLIGHKEAWEWWTKPPPGVAYEWTHPPLAKELMTLSMFLFHSQDGWAWRLPGSLLGVLSVFLVYLLAEQLLKSKSAAVISTFIFSIDGLNFVQSRVGMNDIYYVTFLLASLWLILRKKYFLSAVAFGLAISSKWAAIYFVILILYIIFHQRQFKKLVFFFIIPPLVYLASYLPFFLLGHNFHQIIQLHQQMWWYHTKLKATHAYSSPWWSWPLNLYPVWYFVDYGKNTIANIFASGNPAVFWVGFASVILTGFEAVKKRSFNLLVIILGFLTFWLPWALSPRIMFLYHFSPSVPFLSLCLGHQLNTGFAELKNRKLVIILLILLALNFLIMYPFLTGVPIPRQLVKLFFLTNLSKNPF